MTIEMPGCSHCRTGRAEDQVVLAHRLDSTGNSKVVPYAARGLGSDHPPGRSENHKFDRPLDAHQITGLKCLSFAVARRSISDSQGITGLGPIRKVAIGQMVLGQPRSQK